MAPIEAPPGRLNGGICEEAIVEERAGPGVGRRPGLRHVHKTVCFCDGLPAIGAGAVLICSHCLPHGLLDCSTVAASLLVTGTLGSLSMIGPECADVWRPLPTLVELMRRGLPWT